MKYTQDQLYVYNYGVPIMKYVNEHCMRIQDRNEVSVITYTIDWSDVPRTLMEMTSVITEGYKYVLLSELKQVC